MNFAILIFGLSAAGLLYVLAGYPLLLWLRTRKRFLANAPSSGRSLRTVTIIIAVRNGAPWLRSKLDCLLALDYPSDLIEILLVCDNCTDNTENIGRSYAPRVKVLRSPGSGKAAAINHALEHATGEILFFTDVRQIVEPEALRVLVSRFDNPRIGVASGELIIRTGNKADEHNVGLYWRFEKWIRRRHSAIDSVVGATGAIYAIRRSLAQPMPPDTLLDDVQLPIGAFLQGYRIVFVEEAKAYDSPTALDVEFRRKVRTLAGVYQLIARYPSMLGPRNRMLVHFLSHKCGRLMLPYFMAAIFVSSFFLPLPWSATTVGLQLLFYAAVLLDPMVPERMPIKRVTSMARTFTTMVVAALLASSILFRSSRLFWQQPTHVDPAPPSETELAEAPRATECQ